MSIFWWGPVRVVCFWAVVIGVSAAIDYAMPALDFAQIWATLSNVAAGTGHQSGNPVAEITTPGFATSLALALGALGAGLLAGFLVMHALIVRFSMLRARLIMGRHRDRKVFLAAYETRIYPRLVRHPLIGHAWKEFDETLLKGERAIGGVIGNTVRPQAFIGYALAREKLSGLKVIGSISGYFVGIGLLLTFVGIVLALNEAGQSVKAGSAEDMQTAMANLLSIASFKFSTSIAGLLVSIVFGLGAKLVVIWIEGGFSRFCEAVERQLLYVAPQSVTAEMNEVAKEQRDQLKEINSDRYFTKLAESISPLIEAAMARAMSPVQHDLSRAVGTLTTSSQTGVSELLKEFSTAVHGGAGTELRQLGDSLRAMQDSLAETQRGLHGTGEDFSRRMSQAAENLNRLVGEAGARLEGGAEQTGLTLQQLAATLESTFERANGQLDRELTNAASGASAKLESMVSGAMMQLEAQLQGFMGAIASFQTASSDNLAETRAEIAAAQSDAAAQIGRTAVETAQALHAGLVGAFERIAEEIARFEQAMQRGAAAYAVQTNAVGDATAQTRVAADAFAHVAGQVREAAVPLLRAGEQVTHATAEITVAVTRTTASLEQATAGSVQLAAALTDQTVRLGEMWAGYKTQFERVDEAMAGAVAKLAEATDGQSARLTDFATRMDSELARVLDRLHPAIGQIGSSVEELAEILDGFAREQIRAAAE